jgi:hypothetical protein
MNPAAAKDSLQAQLTDPGARAAPFTDAELSAAMRNPAVAIDLLLAQRERWTASVVENRDWPRMLGLLLLWSLLFSLPYGLVLSYREAWQISILFLGTIAICLPSLHVVSAYIGLRVHLAQSISFATIIAAVASMFSFGFAPILWFLQATSEGVGARDSVAQLSALLLLIAALAGAVHGMRCLMMAKEIAQGPRFSLVVLLWQLLLLFIGLRMSAALGLT